MFPFGGATSRYFARKCLERKVAVSDWMKCVCFVYSCTAFELTAPTSSSVTSGSIDLLLTC